MRVSTLAASAALITLTTASPIRILNIDDLTAPEAADLSAFGVLPPISVLEHLGKGESFVPPTPWFSVAHHAAPIAADKKPCSGRGGGKWHKHGHGIMDAKTQEWPIIRFLTHIGLLSPPSAAPVDRAIPINSDLHQPSHASLAGFDRIKAMIEAGRAGETEVSEQEMQGKMEEHDGHFYHSKDGSGVVRVHVAPMGEEGAVVGHEHGGHHHGFHGHGGHRHGHHRGHGHGFHGEGAKSGCFFGRLRHALAALHPREVIFLAFTLGVGLASLSRTIFLLVLLAKRSHRHLNSPPSTARTVRIAGGEDGSLPAYQELADEKKEVVA